MGKISEGPSRYTPVPLPEDLPVPQPLPGTEHTSESTTTTNAILLHDKDEEKQLRVQVECDGNMARNGQVSKKESMDPPLSQPRATNAAGSTANVPGATLEDDDSLPVPPPPPPVLTGLTRNRNVETRIQRPGAYHDTRTSADSRPHRNQSLYKGGIHVLGREGEAGDPMPEGSIFFDNNPQPRPSTVVPPFPMMNEEDADKECTDHEVDLDLETLDGVHDPNTPAKVTWGPSASNKIESSCRTRAYEQRRTIGVVVVLGVVGILLAIMIVVIVGSRSSSSVVQEQDNESNQNGPVLVVPSLEILFPDPQDLPFATQKAIVSHDTELPQVMAFQWLARDPNAFQYSYPQLKQRLALATFYYATNGPNWYMYDRVNMTMEGGNSSWLDYHSHECEWTSTTTTTNTLETTSPTCHNYSRNNMEQNSWDQHYDYQSLILQGDPGGGNTANDDERLYPALQGSLVPELALLTSLERIDLGYQKLKNSIPTELVQLSSTLRVISLPDNFFSGTIPVELFSFLELFNMRDNERLDPSSIPTTIGSNDVLTFLDLSNARITGTIPTEMGQVQNLEYLSLRSNSLQGTIPTELGALELLHTLNFDDNNLGAWLPSEVAQLTSLRYLVLASNSFSGTLPVELWHLSDLEFFDASYNRLEGPLHPEMFAVGANSSAGSSSPTCPKLRVLNLIYNKLRSSIPTQIGMLNSARQILLMNNNLYSSLPTELGKLLLLQELDVTDNELSGIVPSELGLVDELRRLGLGNNAKLHGTLPTTLCNRSGLEIVGSVECP